jgi:hypothetical protein
MPWPVRYRPTFSDYAMGLACNLRSARPNLPFAIAAPSTLAVATTKGESRQNSTI